MVSSLHSRSRHQIDRTGWDAVLGDQLVGTTKGITFRLVVEERPAHDFDLTLRQVNTPDEFRWRGEMWGVLAGTHFPLSNISRRSCADPPHTCRIIYWDHGVVHGPFHGELYRFVLIRRHPLGENPKLLFLLRLRNFRRSRTLRYLSSDDSLRIPSRPVPIMAAIWRYGFPRQLAFGS